MDFRSFMMQEIDGEFKFLPEGCNDDNQCSASLKSVNNEAPVIDEKPLTDLDIHEFPSAKEVKDSADCHWVVAHVTPPSWKKHLRQISIKQLCDIHDRAYMLQVVLDNVLNYRTHELISTLHNATASCDAIWAKKLEKDRAYAELERKCNEALLDLDKNPLVDDMRTEIETLQGPDCYWVVAHVTPPSWKKHLRQISIKQLCDIHDRAYMLQARKLEKDRAYAELERKCNEALLDLDKNPLVDDIRTEIETLQGRVDGLHKRERLKFSEIQLLQEMDALKQDRASVVAKVVPDAATKLIRSDEMDQAKRGFPITGLRCGSMRPYDLWKSYKKGGSKGSDLKKNLEDMEYDRASSDGSDDRDDVEGVMNVNSDGNKVYDDASGFVIQGIKDNRGFEGVNVEGSCRFNFTDSLKRDSELEDEVSSISKSNVVKNVEKLRNKVNGVVRSVVWPSLNEVNRKDMGSNVVLSSSIGNPIIMDRITTFMCEKSYGRASFARGLIEVDATKELPDSIEIYYSRGGLNGRGGLSVGRGGVYQRENNEGMGMKFVPVRNVRKRVDNVQVIEESSNNAKNNALMSNRLQIRNNILYPCRNRIHTSKVANRSPYLKEKAVLAFVVSRFLVKIAWDAFRNSGTITTWHHIVWFSHNVPRHAFLLWLIMRNSLKTQDKLGQWAVGIGIDLSQVTCVFCSSQPDSHAHLFFECQFSALVGFSGEVSWPLGEYH
nr:hypothetical protein [Tanacetum cinerariifolium]